MAKLTVPYLKLRNGRPRWHPTQRIIERGFRGQDLKYPPTHPRSGEWMDEGDAVAAARQLNEASRGNAPQAVADDDRSFKRLFHLLKNSPRYREPSPDHDAPATTGVKVGIERLRIMKRTRDDYVRLMNRLEVWCGDVQVIDLTPAMVEEFYHDQVEGHSLPAANKLMRVLKLAINHAVKKLRWLDFNPVSSVRIVEADGRLEIFETHEIAAILAAADWCRLPSIGDAFVIGVMGGPRKQDILVLPEGEITDGYYVLRQQKKRGVRAFVPYTAPLVARVTAMRARKAATWPNILHTLEIINSRTGLPYGKSAQNFGDDWRMVRGVAAGDPRFIAMARQNRGISSDPDFAFAPSVAAKLFSDTRDTAVTMLFMAGCSVAEIANITGHSLKTVELILDKHYFKRNAEMAKTAGAKLDAFLANSTIRWA